MPCFRANCVYLSHKSHIPHLFGTLWTFTTFPPKCPTWGLNQLKRYFSVLYEKTGVREKSWHAVCFILDVGTKLQKRFQYQVSKTSRPNRPTKQKQATNHYPTEQTKNPSLTPTLHRQLVCSLAVRPFYTADFFEKSNDARCVKVV